MEQNKFEKDIQQKLDEMKIPPSEAVWQKVEKRIEKRHRRRWMALILFFLFLIIFTGGYWLLNSERNNLSQNKNNVAENTAMSPSKENSSSNKSFPADKNDSSKSIIENEIASNTSGNSANKTDEPHKPKSRKTTFSGKGNYIAEVKNVAASQNEIENSPGKKDEKLQNDLSQDNTDLALHEKENVDSEIQKPESQNNVQDSVSAFSIEKNKSEKYDVDSTQQNKKPAKSIQNKKWHLGVTASAGMSIIGNEFLGINNNLSYSDYVSAPSTGSGSGPGIPSYYSPSAVKNSFAFIAGVFAEKNISVNHKISFGLNYKYFSSLNAVGNKIDSVSIAYNSFLGQTGSNRVNHRNNFNYLELPVSLKFRLNRNNSVPLYWQAGMSISQLISSNALQFKSSPGLYYNDNSLFNKTQLGFSTGFSATLFSKQKIPLTIGPYYYYSASRLADKGLYRNKHFSFAGLRTEILFQKK